MMINKIKNTRNIYTIYKCLHYFDYSIMVILYAELAVLYVDAKISK